MIKEKAKEQILMLMEILIKAIIEMGKKKD